MESRAYTSEGIVLLRKKYGEADRILSLYSSKFGKISVLAKGIRRPKSRKRGHLEVFSHINFQATKSDGLGIMTEADTIHSFEKIRSDLKKVSLAYYFCEVINKITHEHDENIEIFRLLVNTLIRLETETKLKSLRKFFITKLLEAMGYWPREEVLEDPDRVLSEVLEREINSVKIGMKMIS